ncbi:MAG: hypothetical protein DRP03_02610 [Candidatus Aenigmatarchaeota archaeon]|nr:MAG: hypothetical protein DRP03_02610 [Candidatus Aenigmarchaeota archaeon]
MIKRHWFVTLIDLPEALPFVVKESEIAKEVFGENVKGSYIEKLISFIKAIENEFGYEVAYVGEEAKADKYYTRFLFKDGGLLEIMIQAPCAIIAHFIEREKAERFAATLRNVLDRVVKDKTMCQLLKDSIELSSATDEALTYEKWSEMRNIRELVGGE